MRIEDWRKEIDAIDTELLRLLSRRAQCAIEVAKLKTEVDLPVNDPWREHCILLRAGRANGGPLENEAVSKLFRAIIRECRRAALRAARVARVQVEEGLP